MNKTNCKHCNFENTVKFGTYKGNQRYYCKDCKRKFTALDTLPKMKTPVNQISSALSMYYGGMPLDSIQRHIDQEHDNYLSEAGIYKWIIRFTREAIRQSRLFKPKVGNTWIVDETTVNIEGKKVWFWDIIDIDSRYLLASHISTGRFAEDAYTVLTSAATTAGKLPQRIISDRLGSYQEGIDIAFGDKVKHIKSEPFTKENSTNIIERFHGTLKDRVNVLRGFKNWDAARLLTSGWLIHYNFFKEHESLGNVSPAQKMEIPVPFQNWQDIVRNAGKTTAFSSEQDTEIAPFPKLKGRQLHRHQVRQAKRRYYQKKKAERKSQTVQRIVATRKRGRNL
ncbi:MAG: IS1/IS6 family transposase [Chloroflexi bacterium]|nr:IS1/IS6 family transposase [Chloroflexota bacterium]MBM3173246.1 IS1/IS6 family transposase [Chloroflexota bacterium]MBM3175311.1 IS1/IS6 family transposase [Chloroflexota bacterium]